MDNNNLKTPLFSNANGVEVRSRWAQDSMWIPRHPYQSGRVSFFPAHKSLYPRPEVPHCDSFAKLRHVAL